MMSVIIPNLHSPIVDQVVAALEQQTARAQIAEIIVVGQDRYGRVPAQARLIETPQPVSAAKARNLGARAATGDILLFLDADCIARPQLVERLLARQAEGYAVVGGSIALERADYWVLCDNMLTFVPFLSTTPAGQRRFLPSMNFCIRRDVFQQLCGFDERFPGAAGEDLDFNLRLRALGFTLFFEPAATVLHRPARTAARNVWNHLHSFGRAHMHIQQTDVSEAGSRLSSRLRPWSGLIMAVAPLLALVDGLNTLRKYPPLRRFWWTLPGLVWGKTAWYWGVAEALMTNAP